MTTASLSKECPDGRNETEVRARILDAAFAAFMKSGYGAHVPSLPIIFTRLVTRRTL